MYVPDGYAAVKHQFTADGDPTPWMCTYGIKLSEAIGAPVDLANALLDAWNLAEGAGSGYIEVLDDSIVSGPVEVGIGGSSGVPLWYTGTAAFAGENTAAMYPGNCAVTINKRTATPGRSGRGRFFAPGILETGAASVAGALGTGTLTFAAEWADNFLSAVAGVSGVDFMVLLRPTNVGTPLPITSLVPSARVGSQRRRIR